MPVASFGARVGAFLIDVVPIALTIAAIYYFAFGFDAAVAGYVDNPDDLNNRVQFIAQRNQIRDLSFLAYLFYGAILECSAWRATIGKRLLGMCVVDRKGRRLNVGRSIVRNFSKLFSLMPAGLGFIWALWSEKKHGWHDLIAKTDVMIKE